LATVTIPLAVLTAGSHEFGPAAVADADSRVRLDVDRTVSKGATQGLNGQPATTLVSIQASQSGDGGATWVLLTAAGLAGGSYTDPDSGLFTQSSVFVTLLPGTGRQAKAAIVTNTSVAVAGTLTTS
jgi:hypothetical protein